MSETLVINAGTLKSPVVEVESRKVMITGDGLELELTGHATEVRILGDNHKVSAHEVDLFLITGSRNKVHVEILSAARIGGEYNELSWNNAEEGRLSPSISMDGEGNSFSS